MQALLLFGTGSAGVPSASAASDAAAWRPERGRPEGPSAYGRVPADAEPPRAWKSRARSTNGENNVPVNVQP